MTVARQSAGRRTGDPVEHRAEERADSGLAHRREHKHRVGRCIKGLREIAQGLPDRSRASLEALLDEAEKYVQLRHGVVHGIYRENHLLAQFESRRYVPNKEPKQFEMKRVPYDRNSLMLAMTRANNVTADLLDGLRRWAKQLDV
jgi:hypothetical protein